MVIYANFTSLTAVLFYISTSTRFSLSFENISFSDVFITAILKRKKCCHGLILFSSVDSGVEPILCAN